MNIRKIAEKVFEIESKQIGAISSQLTVDFEYAVKAVARSKGNLIISAMGSLE